MPFHLGGPLMKLHPCVVPLLERLEPYGDWDSIGLALKLDILEDHRWWWYWYKAGDECIHWWTAGDPRSPSFMVLYQDHVEVLLPGSGRQVYSSVQAALEDIRGRLT